MPATNPNTQRRAPSSGRSRPSNKTPRQSPSPSPKPASKETSRASRRRGSEATATARKRASLSVDGASANSDNDRDERKESDKPTPTQMTQANDSAGKLEDEDWYHGLISRDDIPRLLKENGDFLVRYTELEDKSKSYVLSVMCEGSKDQIRHLVIEDTMDKHGIKSFFLHRGRKFASIGAMIDHYVSPAAQQHPLDGDVVLIKAIKRDLWELTHTQLDLGKKLGEGAFGIVYSGMLRQRGGGKPVRVAVKEAHKNVPMDKATKDELMHEARIMFQNQHPNIVRIYGVAATQPPICIGLLLVCVMELIEGGTLKEYVTVRPKIAKSELARYCQHASSGLRFLHDKNVVHRDVAARNCLIQLAAGTHTHHTVKLSDFGLAKGINGEEKLKKNTKMPIKWLAPETMNRRTFDKTSDVWSFGVLVWEVFSRGDDPYPSLDSLKQVMTLVKSGGHMSAEDCELVPPPVRPLLSRCWAKNPSERPLMETVKKDLKEIFYHFIECEKASARPNRTKQTSRR